MNMWWQLALIVLLVLVNAALAGSEVALISLRESQLTRLERSGPGGARTARLARDPNRFMSAVQLGITLAGFLASAVAALSLAEPLVPLIRPLGEWAEPLAVIAITLALTAFTLVFGELVPKRLAMQRAEEWASIAAPVVGVLATVAAPLIWFLSRLTDILVRVLGGDPRRRMASINEEEVRHVIETGAASPQHREILIGALDLARRRLAHILVPRREVVAFQAGTPAPEALLRLVDVTHSRAPVYGRDLDDVIGVVNLRDLVHSSGRVADHMRPPMVLPRSLLVLPALAQMQDRREQMAIVCNEYGGTEGIVTLEDLLEEVVGEINDEFDRDQRAVTRLTDGAIEVAGSMPVHDLHDMGIEVPTGPYATVAGLVNDRLGRLARPDDSVLVQGWNIQVLEVGEHAVRRVRIKAAALPDLERLRAGKRSASG